MRQECWQAWWWELSPQQREHWASVAAQLYLSAEQLRRLQYEGLMSTAEGRLMGGERRVLTPRQLVWLAERELAMGA